MTTSIQGVFYDGKTSRSVPAKLLVDGGQGLVHLTWEDRVDVFSLQQIHVSDRLGQTPRSFRFPDGGKFETLDNDVVDQVLASLQLHPYQRFLYRLESRLPLVLVICLLIGVLIWGVVVFGMPALAARIAGVMPPSASLEMGKDALDLMERQLFEPSRLTSTRRRELEAMFQELVAGLGDQIRFRLLIRHGKALGANAFALPNGAVIVTDELVELAGDDLELLGVLAHEVGHVVHRHALRRAIQDSMVTLLMFWITGDFSSATSLAAAVPTLLVDMHYSRDLEYEADTYALKYLCRHGYDSGYFATMLERLQGDHRAKVPAYLSTHPLTEERIERARNACPARKSMDL